MKDSEKPTENTQENQLELPRPRPKNETHALAVRRSAQKIIPFTGKTREQIKGSAKRQLKRIEKKSKETQKALQREQKRVYAARSAVKDVFAALNDKKAVLSMETVKHATPTMREALKEKVVFEPNPGPQTDFLSAPEKEVLYGGARGGGKTASLIIDPTRNIENPNHRFLFIRRTMGELRDVIYQTKKIYSACWPKAKFREQEREWLFPSGARGEFGYCENDDDLMRYQGQAYTWIGVDEIGQFSSPKILYDLRGSLRTTDTSIQTHFRATANPGGPGHLWLKQEFVDPATPGTPFVQKVETPFGIREITRRFIPAKLQDNPYLMKDDAYLTALASLPEDKRRQWLDGDWDVIGGAAFPEFNRKLHVISADTFRVPITWPRFRACDWGYSSPFCVLWFAVDPDDVMYCYREFYGKGMDAKQFSDAVRFLEKDDQKPMNGVMDASVWAKRGDVGPSVAETMNRNGLGWRPSDRAPNSRINGKAELHRRLAIDPMLQKRWEEMTKNNPLANPPRTKLIILDNCKNLLRTLPMLPTDENNPEDIDTKTEDHAYDALRYAVMSRPLKGTGGFEWKQSAPRRPIVDSTFGY